jgi:hypothetical protein
VNTAGDNAGNITVNERGFPPVVHVVTVPDGNRWSMAIASIPDVESN